nr:MAG TPA: hypothetical protein [Caudoviricetes sp.]
MVLIILVQHRLIIISIMLKVRSTHCNPKLKKWILHLPDRQHLFPLPIVKLLESSSVELYS